MTIRSLHLAKGLDLPLDVVTQKLAWLGVTGSGKTYGASKLFELLFQAGAQVVALDPVGVWYGLRLDKGGKKPSDITVPIFGGLHGDVPLEPTGGALLANLIVDKALSAIVDVSQFESDAAKARFAADFADRLFQRRKAAPSAMHLFLEECQEFVPQNPQRGDERMLHVFTRMQKLGRNYGIGSSYLSQRPQEVNKKALNMAQTLFVFRTTGVHERKAIESWVHDKALDQDIAGDLPKIATGHCHVWSPEFLEISHQVAILPKDTFNASATPEVGAAAVTRELAPIDLAKIAKDMAATIEKAKADDPRELRKQIAELKKQVADGVKQSVEKAPIGQVKNVPVLTDTDRALLEKLAASMKATADMMAMYAVESIQRIGQEVRDRLSIFAETSESIAGKGRDSFVSKLEAKGFQKILGKLATVQPTAPPSPARAAVPRPSAPSAPPSRAARAPSAPVNRGSHEGSLPPGEHATLTAALQYPDGLDRKRLGILTGYKRSSRDAYIARLAQKGLVSTNGTFLYPTDDGRAAMNGSFEPLPTGADLIEYWRAKLPEGERASLEVLIAAAGADVARDDIDAATGYKRSSRDAYLTRLKARGLVEFSGRGMVRASEELFS